MSEKIAELVRELYLHPEHRRTIDMIVKNLPALGKLRDEIQQRLIEDLQRELPGQKWSIKFSPKYGLDLAEVKLMPTRLRDHEIYDMDRLPLFAYWLHADRASGAPNVPKIGDSVRIYLWAHCDRDEKRECAAVIAKELCERVSTAHEFGPDGQRWQPIWAGDCHELVDLGSEDVGRIVELFRKSLDATYSKLCDIAKRVAGRKS